MRVSGGCRWWVGGGRCLGFLEIEKERKREEEEEEEEKGKN